MSLQDWIGVYASPAEIGGFSGTVIAFERSNVNEALSYRMLFYTDLVIAGEIEDKEPRGEALVEADRVYVPKASGFMHDGKPSLSTSVTRYTRKTINGQTVLMRDDALRALTQQNKRYDYGILIKVPGIAEPPLDLERVEHPSIKTLYENPDKAWRDPFVNGPNER